MVSRPGKYQPRFTSGELDPLFTGNTDEADYFKGASWMANLRPFPQGGFGNVWGTRAIGRVPAGATRIRSFTKSRDIAYDFVLRAGHIDVFKAGAAAGAGAIATIAIGYADDQIAALKNVQQLDTMILFHQDTKPQRVRRMGSDISWGVDDAPFVNTPNYDYGAVYTNGVPAVWAITPFNVAAGNHAAISVNGVASPAFVWSTATAGSLQAIVLAIPGVNPGVTVTAGPASTPSGVAIASGSFGIEFSGTDNQGDGWAVSVAIVDNSSAAVTSAHLQVGVYGGEPVMSAPRGWPACGVFYGARLVIAGFKSTPNTFLASQVGNFFNLDTRFTTASAPMLVPVDTDGAASIVEIHKGRTLNFFMDAGEYWLNGASLDRTVVPTIVLATTNGISATVPVVENEGATLYVEREGGTLSEFRFDYAQQNYASNNLSVRNPALITGIVDMAIRKRAVRTDCNELTLVRGDGMAVVAHLLRAENINAFTRRITDGSFRAVNVNDQFETGFVVERMVGNAPVQFFERIDESVLLDGAIDFDLGAPGLSVGGLADHEGRTVWAVADAYVQGPFTVAGGHITLTRAATAGYVGRWTAPLLKTLPQPRDVGPRTVNRRPARVHTVRVSVVDTTSIAIGANAPPGQDPVLYDVPLSRWGAVTDAPPLDTPFTGEVVLEGLPGFSVDAIVGIGQVRPGLLNVTGVTVEVDL